MFNHFNLSCDFMEPFRVLVDEAVFDMKPECFEKEQKHALWEILKDTVRIDNAMQNVSNAIKIYNLFRKTKCT